MKKFKFSILFLIVLMITSCASISFPGHENGVTVTVGYKIPLLVGENFPLSCPSPDVVRE